MASIIRIKRSELSGNPAVLGAGELAYSALQDNGSNGGDRLYIGTGTETAGNAVNHVVIGGKYFTDQVNAATPDNDALSIVRRDASGNFVAGTITSDLIGDVTGNADTATAWLNARTLQLTGDATASLTGVDGTSNVSASITLATVNSNVGTFGSTTQIPVVTVNGKGLVTALSTVSVATSLSIAGGTGTDTVDLLSDSLTFAGGTGVTTAVTDNTVTFSIGQAVNTNSNVQFNDVTVDGTLYSNDITATSVNVDGDAVITGNLTVQGTTTTVNSVTVSVVDKNIEIASDAATAAEADGAGITVLGPTIPATITYSSTDNRWNLNKDLNVNTVYGDLVGNAATASIWETARTLQLTGDATASMSVDGSQNVSTAITLATVNSNIGSFGNSVTVPTITVNAKGLVTGVTTTAIPTASTSVQGLANFSSTNFAVASGTVSIIQVDGGTY